jgi:hypothetical protein
VSSHISWRPQLHEFRTVTPISASPPDRPVPVRIGQNVSRMLS